MSAPQPTHNSVTHQQPASPLQANPQRIDSAKHAFSLHYDAFKNRYELFVKAVGLYLGVVGVSIGYITRSDVESPTRCALSRWVADIEKNVTSISAAVGVPSPPFYDASMVQRLSEIVAFCIFAASIVNLVYELLKHWPISKL